MNTNTSISLKKIRLCDFKVAELCDTIRRARSSQIDYQTKAMATQTVDPNWTLWAVCASQLYSADVINLLPSKQRVISDQHTLSSRLKSTRLLCKTNLPEHITLVNKANMSPTFWHSLIYRMSFMTFFLAATGCNSTNVEVYKILTARCHSRLLLIWWRHAASLTPSYPCGVLRYAARCLNITHIVLQNFCPPTSLLGSMMWKYWWENAHYKL